MIKATIQSSPYCTEITFPCTETELSKKLGELGMNPEHLAPMATVIQIEPTKLSMLEDCEVSLDALNYLGKRLDGMDKLERKQFLAVLSCDEAEIGYGLKNIINLTDNLARYTLIEDTDDLERVGLIHMLNARGGLSESEYTNSEWLIAEGTKLLESGKGIDTEFSEAGVSLIFAARTYSPFIISADAYFPITSSEFFITSDGILYAPTSTTSISFEVISCPIFKLLFTRTIFIVLLFEALKSGVIAKQIISDSTIHTTPRTVLFFKNFIVIFPFRKIFL